MDIVGFVEIKKNATTCAGAEDPDEFIGKTCRVIEFNKEGGVLVLNPEATALAMFDKEDISRGFRCGYVNGVVTPPDMDSMSQMMYASKATTRKGGYNQLLANMVIQASLSKGEFHDSMLWAKQ